LGSEGVAAARFAAALIVSIPVIMYSEHRFLGIFNGDSGVRLELGSHSQSRSRCWCRKPRSYSPDDPTPDSLLAGIVGGLVYLATLLLAGFVTDDDKEMLRWAFMRRPPTVAETTE
jgi:hypothetical protein